MPTDKPSDYQDELDVYQAAWTIGKQRGVDVPLKRGQLKALVEAGRLTKKMLNKIEVKELDELGVAFWDSLSEEQKSVFGEDEPEKKTYEELSPINKARIVVSLLIQLMKQDYKKLFEGGSYEKLDEEEKVLFGKYFFRVLYGYTPEYLSVKLSYLFS